MKYNEKIHKYYEDNTYVGLLDESDLSVGSSLVGAPACGDVMKLQIKVDQNIIKDAKIKVFGCGSAKASSSLAVEMLIGKTIEEATKITNEDIRDELGLPSQKFHCSVLAADAISKALENYKEKNISNEKVEENSSVNNGISSFNFVLKLSNEAEDYLSKFLLKQQKQYLGVRIDLVTSNCGLSYKIKGVVDSSDIGNDIICKIGKINFFVDRKIAPIINNTQMEFKKDNLKSGIFFVNPNEVGRCGCGINFKLPDTHTDESNCNK